MYLAYASPSCLRTAPFQIRAIIVPPPSLPRAGRGAALPAAPVGENIGGPFLQRGGRAARAGHRGAARGAAAAGLGQRGLAGRLGRLRPGRRAVRHRPPGGRGRRPGRGHLRRHRGRPGRRLPDRGPAGDAAADLARPRPAVLPAPRHGRDHRGRRGRLRAVRPAPLLQPGRAARPPAGPVRPGRDHPPGPARPGRAGRHPGRGRRRHRRAAAVHPAAGRQGGPPGRRPGRPRQLPAARGGAAGHAVPGAPHPGPPRLRQSLHPRRPARRGPGDADGAVVRGRPGRPGGHAAPA